MSDSLVLEVGQGKDDLHDRVHVAAVAQVHHARVAGAVHRLQLAPSLLNHVPLPNLLVEVNLQLNHRLLCLWAQTWFICVNNIYFMCCTHNVQSIVHRTATTIKTTSLKYHKL